MFGAGKKVSLPDINKSQWMHLDEKVTTFN